MNITGDFRLSGPRELVWEVINDPQVLARCLPGCERLEPEGDDVYAADLKVGVAAVRGTYRGRLRVTEKRPPDSLRLRIEAQGTGGFVHIDGGIVLDGDGEASRAAYDWAVQVGGPVAMVGSRVLGGVARAIINEFFTCLDAEVRSRAAGRA